MRPKANWAELLNQTFDWMARSGPKPLMKRLGFVAEEARAEEDPGAVLMAALLHDHSPVRAALQAQLSTWDYALRETWSTTPHNTIERRREISSLLEMPLESEMHSTSSPPGTHVHFARMPRTRTAPLPPPPRVPPAYQDGLSEADVGSRS